MNLFKRRSKLDTQAALYAFFASGGGSLPPGYRSLLDAPEVSACIDRIAGVISSATIYLMRNTPKGDERVKNRLSRFVDVTPWPDMGTRQIWMSWIVTQLLGPGDGNAFVLPQTRRLGQEYAALLPMPGAAAVPTPTGYEIRWRGRTFRPDEVLHFRLHADPDYPWKGRGFQVQADALAASLRQTQELKDSLSAPDYKPPLIVSVDTDADLADEEKREAFRRKYLEDTDTGKPWILPAGLLKVEQLRPLSLNDLAIRDTMELDKRAVAAIFGAPPFLVGVGEFRESEYNNFVRTVIVPICTGIAQELTAKLLENEEMYFRFNDRRLYAYDMRDIVEMDLAMSARGFLTGDEAREDAGRDPAGLTEFQVLENYIPYDMTSQQKKLIQEVLKDADT